LAYILINDTLSGSQFIKILDSKADNMQELLAKLNLCSKVKWSEKESRNNVNWTSTSSI